MGRRIKGIYKEAPPRCRDVHGPGPSHHQLRITRINFDKFPIIPEDERRWRECDDSLFSFRGSRFGLGVCSLHSPKLGYLNTNLNLHNPLFSTEHETLLAKLWNQDLADVRLICTRYHQWVYFSQYPGGDHQTTTCILRVRRFLWHIL